MALIKSISGIRGTIGGKPGDSLTPVDIVKFSAAFGTWVKSRNGKKIVIGRTNFEIIHDMSFFKICKLSMKYIG